MTAAIPRAFLLLCFFVVLGLLLFRGGHASAGEVYDVTEYGAATRNSDNKDAFLAAWRAACGSPSGNATLLFPNASFAVGAVEFSGPCTNGDAPVVVIDSVLRPSWRSLSGDAWITFADLNNLVVTGAGTLDGQGNRSGQEGSSKPTTLVLVDVTNSTLSGLWFVNSRGFHVNLRRCAGIVASGLHIHAAASSRNTDGIHVGLSRHVRVLDSVIGTGDDCVSVGPGSSDVLVSGVACGPGHGISVGSLGKGEDEEEEDVVRGLVVRNCTLRGTTNGARIKTWAGGEPGRASNITFEGITMDGVSNPIIIDQKYCPHGRCHDADKPSRVQISDVTFKQIEGTSSSRVAVQLVCSEDRPCRGVRLVNISLSCGDRPCLSEFANVQGMPPSPSPIAAARRLEEETASGTERPCP